MNIYQHETEIFKMGITKSDIPGIANSLVEDVLENGHVLDIAENIKMMEELMDAVKQDNRFKDYALEELAKYGKQYVSPRGIKIEPFSAGGRYDFSVCNDPIYNELEAKFKERQEFLKKLPKEGMDIVTTEGEVVRIYPANKPVGSSTYKITLPK